MKKIVLLALLISTSAFAIDQKCTASNFHTVGDGYILKTSQLGKKFINVKLFYYDGTAAGESIQIAEFHGKLVVGTEPLFGLKKYKLTGYSHVNDSLLNEELTFKTSISGGIPSRVPGYNNCTRTHCPSTSFKLKQVAILTLEDEVITHDCK
jgi:hypothetical protein